jgi:hypothetical protein
VKHCVSLPAEQGIDRDAVAARKTLETQSLDFVSDEDLALIGGQFVQGFLQGREIVPPRKKAPMSAESAEGYDV